MSNNETIKSRPPEREQDRLLPTEECHKLLRKHSKIEPAMPAEPASGD